MISVMVYVWKIWYWWYLISLDDVIHVFNDIRWCHKMSLMTSDYVCTSFFKNNTSMTSQLYFIKYISILWHMKSIGYVIKRHQMINMSWCHNVMMTSQEYEDDWRALHPSNPWHIHPSGIHGNAWFININDWMISKCRRLREFECL